MQTIEEQKVGGSSTQNQMSEFPPEASDSGGSKVDDTGPLEERLVSKNWGVRAKAFEELANVFTQSSDKPSTYKGYSCSFKKYLGDSNPAALEKAIHVVQIFSEYAPRDQIAESQSSLVKILVEKGATHAKPTIKTKSIECVLSIIQASDEFESLEDGLIELINSKNLKVSIAGCSMVHIILKEFGLSKLKIKSYLAPIMKLTESSNGGVRGEAMTFYKESIRWMGDALKPTIEKLRKAQQDELNKYQSELNNEQVVAIRFTKKDQAKQKELALDDICKAAEAVEKVDAYDLADSEDILPHYQDEWCDKVLEIKKWNEKKEKIEELVTAASVPKIKAGVQTALLAALKKLINDSNVMVSQTAVKAAGSLAKGLRSDFTGSKSLVGVILLRFKEKRQAYLEELHNTLEAFIQCSSLDEIYEEVCSTYSDKAPNIKKNTSIFLEKAIRVTYIDPLQKIGKDLCSKINKLTDDSNPEVRDTALTVIGVLKGRLGETFMGKFLTDLNPQKRAKVDEAAATVQPSKYDKSQKSKIVEEPIVAEKPKKKKKQAVVKKVDEDMIEASASSFANNSIKAGGYGAAQMEEDVIVQPKKDMMSDVEMMESNNDESMGVKSEQMEDAVVMKPKKKVPAKEEIIDMEIDSSQNAKPAAAPPKRFQNKEKAKPNAADVKKGPPTLNIQEDDLGSGLSKEEALAKLEDLMGADVTNLLDATKWQEKVEGYKAIASWMTENEDEMKDISISEAVAKTAKSKLKEWKESNMNIVKETLNLLLHMGKVAPKVNKRTFQCIAPFLSEKIGDTKYKELCNDALLTYSELVGPGFVAKYVMKHATESKSPNVLKENANFISNLVEEFTVVGDFPLKEVIDFGKILLAHSNIAVRTSSISMLSTLYKFVGETIRNFLKDVKEATTKIIDEEFAKITPLKKGELKGKRDVRGDAAEEAGANGGGNALDNMFPRTDIGSQFKEKILKDLTDNNWKIRKEGCEKIEAILDGANMRIQPTNLTEFVSILKRQLNDSNKSVLKAFIQLFGKFSEALGPAAKNFSKTLLKPLLSNLADKQNLVRQDVVATMDKFTVAVEGAETILNLFPEYLKNENPEMRTEILAWMLKNKDAIPKCETKALVTPLVMCLSDKSAAIRGNTELVIMEVMPLTKQGPFMTCVKELKPAFQNQIKPLIEKVIKKCNIGADPLNSSMGTTTGSFNVAKTIKPKHAAETNEDEIKDQAVTTQPQKPRGSMLGGSMKNIQPGGVKRPGRPESGTSSNRVNSRPKTGAASSKNIADVKSMMSDEEVPSNSVSIIIPCSKEKRAEQDRRQKWNMDEPREDLKDKCREYMTIAFPAYEQKLFSKDFKTHVDCVNVFIEIIRGDDAEQITQITDLLVKWTITRFWENINTTFAKAVFEFFDELLDYLDRSEYQLLDFEANIFMILLTEKSGYNQQTIKDKVKSLIKKIPLIYPPKQTFGMLMSGLSVKNLKSRAEVLDEIGYIVKCHGADIATDKEIRIIANLADHSDNGIRSNAVNSIEQLYRYLNENIWQIIGKLPQKAEDIIKTRFKKMGGGIMPSDSKANLDPKSPMNRSTLQFQKTRTGSNSKFNQSGNNITGEKTPVRTKNPLANDPMNKTTVTPRNDKGHENQLIHKINKNSSSSKLGLQDKRQNTSRIESEEKQQFGTKTTLFNSSLRDDQQFGRNTEYQKTSTTPLKEHAGNQEHQRQTFHDQEMDLLDDKNQLQNDPFLMDDQEQDDISKIVRMLKFGDLSKRVDTLVILNDMVSTNVEERKHDLVDRSNDLLGAITHVLMDIFDKPVQEIPLRFAKYFLGVVHKVSSCKYIVTEATDEKIFEFAEQLLTRLLISGLETLGDRKEGELILKSLNGAMLRLLELCKPTSIFCVLIDLLRKYKSYNRLPKLPGLIIKCLLKLTKILDSLIEVLDIQKILMSIHLYLLEHPLQDQSQKSQQDEMGTRIVKTMINELVKLKKEQIWVYYETIERHAQQDMYIKRQDKTLTLRWIQIILKSLGSDPSMPSEYSIGKDNNVDTSGGPEKIESASSGRYSTSMDPDLKRIFEELNDINMFNVAIEKLMVYEDKNPHVDVEQYLKNCSTTLQSFVRKERMKIKEQKDQEKSDAGPQPQSEEKEDNQASILSHGKNINNDSPSGVTGQGSMQKGNPKISEYQRKLATMKQMNKKFNEQGMNKSTSTEKISNFHAMNSSLKDKWEKVNKNSQLRKQGDDQNLSHTIGGAGSSGGSMKFGTGIGMGASGNGNLNSSAGGDVVKESQLQKPSYNSSSNSELINRLNEMKQKLRAIKQQKDQS